MSVPARPFRGRTVRAARRRSRSTSTPSPPCSGCRTRTQTGWAAISHQAYGPLVGVPRILKILANTRHHVDVLRARLHRIPLPGRRSAPSWTAGHEIAHHGYLHERHGRPDGGQRGGDTRPRLATLSRRSPALRPTGYRAPMWELNWHSPKLLRDRGFLYDSSLMDADHPYELAVSRRVARWSRSRSSGRSTTGSSTATCPDFSGSGLIESPVKVAEMWRLEFDAAREVGGCCVLTNHPFLSGRPRGQSRWTT